MSEGYILSRDGKHLPADQHAFDLWLRANAVIGSILGVVIAAMALGGARGPGSATAPAQTYSAVSQAQQALDKPGSQN